MALPVAEVPRRRPVNGRTWKKVEKARHSLESRPKSLSTTYAERLRRKSEIQAGKQEYAALLEKVKSDKVEMRRRREQKRKMKAENEKKAEVVQTITDTRKIKKMSKKQIKMLRKQ